MHGNEPQMDPRWDAYIAGNFQHIDAMRLAVRAGRYRVCRAVLIDSGGEERYGDWKPVSELLRVRAALVIVRRENPGVRAWVQQR